MAKAIVLALLGLFMICSTISAQQYTFGRAMLPYFYLEKNGTFINHGASCLNISAYFEK